MISILPITGIGEVSPGDDIAGILLDALAKTGIALAARDVVVVTQKIVSKAEGRFVDLATVEPGEDALALASRAKKDARLMELVLRESSEIVRVAPGVVISRHQQGWVMANAGIDHSKVGPNLDRVLLLPEAPDKSAAALRASLVNSAGIDVAVLITDSFGRPWRNGVVNVAIGAAGIPSLLDMRGAEDRDGRKLEVTQVALADAIAAAAGLAFGEAAEGVPAVIVRGVSIDGPDMPASALLRPLDQDLFR